MQHPLRQSFMFHIGFLFPVHIMSRSRNLQIRTKLYISGISGDKTALTQCGQVTYVVEESNT